jgi:microcystin-dependent protein
MATVNLGRVGFVNKGTYNGATAYKVNDVVTYNAGTYACIQANTGQAPTNTSYWQNWVEDNAVHKTGNETISGIKTFTSSPIVPTPTTDMQVATKKYVDEKNFGGTVLTTGDQTISGIKTFTSSPIVPTPTTDSQAANKAYVDNSIVHKTGDETIAGIKTFTSSPIVPTPTTDSQAANKAYVDNNLSSIPAGVIVIWSGSSTSIPEGWALCDGLNGTPDLRDRFVIGAGGSYAVGSTGGSADAVVVSHTHTTPNHTHTGTAASAGAHTHTITRQRDTGVSEGSQWGGGGGSNTAVTSSSSGAHTHSLTINSGGGGTSGSAGVSGVGKNLPPYYALAYIMKL